MSLSVPCSNINLKLISQRKRAIYVIYFVAFLDLFAVSLFLPLISREIRDLGASTLLIGVVGSIYGAIQLVSSPIMGRYSDLYGRKRMMVFTLFLSAIAYVLQGLASGLALFLIARCIAGIFKHTQTIGKSFLPSLAPLHKSYVIGNFNAFGSMGYIVGPTVGSYIIEHEGGFRNVCFLSAFAFCMNALFISFFIPESQDTSRKEMIDEKPLLNGNNGIKAPVPSLWKVSALSLIVVLVLRFLFSYAVLTPRANLPLILEEKYGTSIISMGYLGSFQALISTLSGFACGPINSKIFKENQRKIVLFGGSLQLISLIGLYFSTSYRLAGISLLLLSGSNPFLRVALTALSLEMCTDSGTILGWGQSASSTSRMVAPISASFAQEYSIDGPAVVGAMASLLGIFFTLIFVKKSNHREYNEFNSKIDL